jgi:hypothetical protein
MSQPFEHKKFGQQQQMEGCRGGWNGQRCDSQEGATVTAFSRKASANPPRRVGSGVVQGATSVQRSIAANHMQTARDGVEGQMAGS